MTMYNFGSPRVGNRRFAEVYNQVIKNFIYDKLFAVRKKLFHD